MHTEGDTRLRNGTFQKEMKFRNYRGKVKMKWSKINQTTFFAEEKLIFAASDITINARLSWHFKKRKENCLHGSSRNVFWELKERRVRWVKKNCQVLFCCLKLIYCGDVRGLKIEAMEAGRIGEKLDCRKCWWWNHTLYIYFSFKKKLQFFKRFCQNWVFIILTKIVQPQNL